MAVYPARCLQCNSTQDIVRRISERDLPITCLACGGVCVREVVAPAVSRDYPAYDCPITGKRIEGKAAHEANLRLHGCRLREEGETELNARRRAEAEAKFESDVDREIEFVAYVSGVVKP